MKYNKKCLLFKFKEPKIYLFDWIPFGKNYLNNLIEKITFNKGDTFFSNISKMDPENNGIFVTEKQYTKLKLNNIDEDNKIVFSIETKKGKYKLHIDYIGVVTSEFILKKANNQKNFFGFDEISKVIPLISSEISNLIDPLFTSTQKNIINTIYDKNNKSKIILILIKEDLSSFDENILCEIKEVIGNLKKTVIKDGSKIFIGEYGAIVFNYKNLNQKKIGTLFYYLNLRSISKTVSDVYLSLNEISKDLLLLSKKLKKQLSENQIKEFRLKLSEIEKKILFIEICLNFLNDSLENIKQKFNVDNDCEINMKIQIKFKKIYEKLDEINTTLKSNLEYAENITRLLYTFSEDTQFKLSKQLSKNMIQQVAIGEGMELLEASIFGIYFLEVVHILTQLSGYEEFFKHILIFGFNIEFWMLLITAFLGIFIGYSLIRWKKGKILKILDKTSKTY